MLNKKENRSATRPDQPDGQVSVSSLPQASQYEQPPKDRVVAVVGNGLEVEAVMKRNVPFAAVRPDFEGSEAPVGPALTSRGEYDPGGHELPREEFIRVPRYTSEEYMRRVEALNEDFLESLPRAAQTTCLIGETEGDRQAIRDAYVDSVSRGILALLSIRDYSSLSPANMKAVNILIDGVAREVKRMINFLVLPDSITREDFLHIMPFSH